jgi:hypothetical protein
MNLKCHYLESFPSFWVFRYFKETMEFLFLKLLKYIKEMIKRFGMEDCKPVNIPMQISCKLRKDDYSKSIDQR